jgi:probable rRNA maturation factor
MLAAECVPVCVSMIVNRQRGVAVRVSELEKFAARAQRALRLPADSLTICLVTDAEIARWNGAYRSKKRPTDVLSFPVDESGGHAKRRKAKLPAGGRAAPADSRNYIGDIAIAPAVALRNSRELGRTLSEELRILILHGMLHLMGYDHEADNGEMDRREQRLRRALGLA